MNEISRAGKSGSNFPQGHADEFITLQDAAKEFGIYPSVMRVWEREGRLPVGSVNNMRVRRYALINAIEADAKAAAAQVTSAAAASDDGAIALARRILEICASGDADALNTLESEARSILERANAR